MLIILSKLCFAEDVWNSLELQYNIQYIYVHISAVNLNIWKKWLESTGNVFFDQTYTSRKRKKEVICDVNFRRQVKNKRLNDFCDNRVRQIPGEFFPQVLSKMLLISTIRQICKVLSSQQHRKKRRCISKYQ